MLDLKTVLIVTLAAAFLQAFIWICGWRAWRDLYPLKYFAAGFSMITLGVLALVLRGAEPGPMAIVAHNVAIKAGLALLTEGLGRFLNQPTSPRLCAGLLLMYTLFWAGAVTFAPAEVAWRIHSSTVLTLVLMILMCRYLIKDRSQSFLLRLATLLVLAAYMLSSVIQSVIEYRLPTDFQTAAILEDRHAWYLLIGTMFLIAFFACLVFMVGARLSMDLRQRNRSLTAEIATRRELERQLGASFEAERTLREEQANFMRIVGHEFRTPLAVIRNSLDMMALASPPRDPSEQRRHASIRDSLERMFQLIDRFMNTERDPGHLPEWIRAAAVLSELERHFEMTGQAARLQFLSTADDAEIWLHIDPEMLETALINLIDNALKYSPAASLVDIRTETVAGCFHIHIRDYGIGIPEGERHKIGRRFFRASNVVVGSGTGLGLNLTRRLLAYQQGQLALMPAAGGGTIATVTLPLAQPQEMRP